MPLLYTRNKLLLLLLIILAAYPIIAQENPPIPIQVEVNTSQYLNFGSFTAGPTGGNVTVDYNGQRTANGEIFLLSLGTRESPALFDLFANPGTIIHIGTPPEVTLQSNTGGRIYLTINSYSTGQTFVTTSPPGISNDVYIGGTLRIPNSAEAIPGSYSGTFTLIFNHQ